jgi:hypothetical protein
VNKAILRGVVVIRLRTSLGCGLILLSFAAAARAQTRDAGRSVEVAVGERKATVTIGDKLFAEYDFASYARPILYPLLGPGQVSFVRHWPMRDDVPGEAHDHPHHKSLWFAHGDVNGVDFWSEKGSIRNQQIQPAETDGDAWPGLVAVNQWVGPDGPICREVATLRFAATDEARWVDCQYELSGETEIVFGDTKEGTFALRTHPGLNLTRAENGPPAGHAENSAGERDGAIWGRPARWVCYYGQIEEQDCGLAILDHPQNLRHPTTWHARDYGLVAANPFGLHDFLGQPRGSGEFRLPAGESLRLRYRVILFRGPFERQTIEDWFQEFGSR